MLASRTTPLKDPVDMFRKCAFLVAAGLLLVLTGCMPTIAEEWTIYCDSFHMSGITSDTVGEYDVNYDSDGDGELDSVLVWALVIRPETDEILFSSPRGVIPLGQSVQGTGFTSDEFSFPAVPAGTTLTIRYDLFSYPISNLISFTGACQLAPEDPTPDPTAEPTEEPETWQPEWWSPGDDRLNPDPHAYAALFYMVLALATGIFYFTWVVAGFSTAAGLSVTIVGIPLLILFLVAGKQIVAGIMEGAVKA